tara:strand:+ start:3367 stop:3696 length:330 start_codon:yes stop_codon:yes gene_type:complete
MSNKVRVTTSDKVDVTVKEKDRVAYPSMYDVIFLNDDYTPMDFVIHILMSLFGHDELTAQNVTHRIHDNGQGVAGSYFLEIAEQKASEATLMSRQNEFPLQIKVVKHDG